MPRAIDPHPKVSISERVSGPLEISGTIWNADDAQELVEIIQAYFRATGKFSQSGES